MSRDAQTSPDIFPVYVDIGRCTIILALAVSLFFVRPAHSESPTKPVSPDQPWIDKPPTTVPLKAGIVTFEGSGPKGRKVEIVENGRVIAEGWCNDHGRWKANGKVLGDGESAVFVRAVDGLQSRSWVYKLVGHAEPTLAISNPQDDDDIKSGKLTVSGTGKPGDEVLLVYNGRAIQKVTVGNDGKWSTPVNVTATEEGTFKAYSKAEGEICEVVVRGNG